MDVVLGVSMTPAAVRMVLVEGSDANGATIDHHCDTLATGTAADQVLAGILGTRDSAAEGGHRIASIGVAWTDRAAAADLKGMLRANDIDEVLLVSQLHAASALAQAIGQALGCESTALMFLERDTATLAVVRAADGAVVRVESRSLHAADAVARLQHMVAGLERLAQPPQAVFMVGSGIDVAALKPKIAAGTTLTVHAPEDGALALARGAALAAANAPRFEAETVAVAPGTDVPTVAGIITQRAPVGYMAPLGYSAMPNDDEPVASDHDHPADADNEPFMLVGSALMTIFVVGVLALLASIIITIRPAAEQRTDPGENAAVLSTPLPNTQAAETIANPVPVVQEAPRTIFVTPRAAAPVAPAPAVLPEPVLVPAAAPVVPAPVAPAPVVVPIVPQFVPQIIAPPARSTSTPTSTTTSTTTATATSTTTATATSTTTSTTTSTATSTVASTVASTPSASPSATTAQTSTPVESTSSTVESPASSPTTAPVVVTTPLVPSGAAA